MILSLAANKVWSDAEFSGCKFHLCQAVHRRDRADEFLATKISKDSKHHVVLKMLSRISLFQLLVLTRTSLLSTTMLQPVIWLKTAKPLSVILKSFGWRCLEDLGSSLTSCEGPIVASKVTTASLRLSLFATVRMMSSTRCYTSAIPIPLQRCTTSGKLQHEWTEDILFILSIVHHPGDEN